MMTRIKNSPATGIKNPLSERLFLKLTDTRLMGVFLAATVLITIILWRLDAELGGQGGAGLLQLELSRTKSGFTAVLSSWGSAGRELFIATRWIHFVYPLCYSSLLSSVPLFFRKKIHGAGPAFRNWRDAFFFVLPFIAGLLDYGASGLTVFLISGGQLSERIIMLISIFTMGKWVLVILSLIYILARYFSMKKEMLRNLNNQAR